MQTCIVAAGLFAGLLLGSGGTVRACDFHLERPHSQLSRGVTIEDLLELNDIGSTSMGSGGQGIFSLSPDRSKLAFQLRRADAATNSYCIGMFVLDVEAPHSIIQVDQGGEFQQLQASGWGLAVLPPTGVPLTITPLWSPDGKWIAYLRRDKGLTQVWRAEITGAGASQVTHLPVDVEVFSWSQDGGSIITRSRPGLQVADKRVSEEGKSGYHYDERVIPSVSARPQSREPIPYEYSVVTMADKAARPASDAEKAMAEGRNRQTSLPGASWAVTGDGDDLAWVAPTVKDDISAPTALHVRHAGKVSICDTVACRGVVDLWFENAGSILYLTRSSVTGRQALWRWALPQKVPTKLLENDDLWGSCQLTTLSLICGEETESHPRRLLSIDTTTLKTDVLFDPNPQWGGFTLGSVTRLHWSNRYGLETYGDLVLPPGHRPGQKYPLIVVGYAQRGFLRGGTGDEYPIFALAQNGYAVLSYQSPKDIGFLKSAKTWADLERLDRIDWANYRSTASSIEAGVDIAISLGIVDDKRLGLTGMSFGASIAQFELVNSRRFASAILSTCCEENSNATVLGGPAFAKLTHDMGYPRATEDGSVFWKPISLRLNAKEMDTPILLQVSDKEFLGTLESVSALQQQGQAVDEYVYPDEAHVKWQPAHRLAIYRRVKDWFDFWLKDKEDAHPVDALQYARWRSMPGQN